MNDATPWSPPRVPGWALWGFRIAVAALLGIWFCLMYMALRAVLGGVGFSPLRTLAAAATSAGTLFFLAGLTLFAELPEVWFLYRLPARRAARGLCPGCSYPMRGGGFPCPECQGSGRVRPRYEVTWRTAKVFLLLAAAALAPAVAVGETLLLADEAAFVRSASAQPGRVVLRPRRWPAGFAWLVMDEHGHLMGPGPLESPRSR